ncbi:Txe/YoeB family addiction module toxin [Mycobacterium branderi]|uniref:Endoribonuclease YoeB n=1 Tax=Mycobacterium branderi TaxID=43348 RepID=A0ABM7KV34_9MYCO|nr:Txe/YoeB family addiction module toxin [Mycobacterium branderi]BBZ15076.1 toxin RelK [Mycobacterium branderi]
MRGINFDPDAWDDFLFWLASDRKMARRITRLIGEIQREPFMGIGKPEPLRGELSGYWSRRIDDEHRLAYRADDNEVKISKPDTATNGCRHVAAAPDSMRTDK